MLIAVDNPDNASISFIIINISYNIDFSQLKIVSFGAVLRIKLDPSKQQPALE